MAGQKSGQNSTNAAASTEAETMPVVDLSYIQQTASGKYRYRRVVKPEFVPLAGTPLWRSPPMSLAEALAYRDKVNPLNDSLLKRWESGEHTARLSPEDVAGVEAEARALIEAGPDAIDAATEAIMHQAAVARAVAFLNKRKPGKITNVDGGPIPKTPDVTRFLLLDAVENGGRVPVKTVSFSAVYAYDKANYAEKEGGKVRDEAPYITALAKLNEIIGDVDALTLQRSQVIKLRNTLRKQGLKDSAIRRYLGVLRAMHRRWLIDHDKPQTSAWDKLELKGHAGDDGLGLHSSHINALNAYFASGKAPEFERRLIVFMLHTATGPAEAAGIMLKDVYLDHPVPHVWIRVNELSGNKTQFRKRFVPLIGPALDVVKEATASDRGVKALKKGATRIGLFRNTPHTKDTTSRDLGKVFAAAGMPRGDTRIVAYSCRHTMIQALKQSKCRDDLRYFLEGHANPNGVQAHYGSVIEDFEEARDAFLAAIPLLGKVNETQYTERELIISPTWRE
jgi:integrase